MQSISRIVIAVPLLLIVFALVLRAGGFVNPSSQNVQSSITPTIALGATFRRTAEASEQKTTPASISIDLQKEYACNFQNSEGQYEVFIRKGDVRARIISSEKNTHILLKNKCLYTWSQAQKKGTRMCNLGPYLKALESMNKLGIFSFDSMMQNLIAQTGISWSGGQEKLSDFSRLCQQKTVSEDIMMIPEGIEFREVTSLNDAQ